jgi:O-acetyl-ADP-ribose deacetylase (regulator of RNase III)
MAIVKTVQGDLIGMFKERQFNFIAHGCNCFHRMGAGVAGQIAKEFPEAFDEDKTSSNYADSSKLGGVTAVGTVYGGIINAYTQYLPGKSDPELLYDSIYRVFRLIDNKAMLAGFDYKPIIGIPMIGAGIAGGDWDIIKNIIDLATPSVNIVVVEWKK